MQTSRWVAGAANQELSTGEMERGGKYTGADRQTDYCRKYKAQFVAQVWALVAD